jgi:hypothetical protein
VFLPPREGVDAVIALQMTVMLEPNPTISEQREW